MTSNLCIFCLTSTRCLSSREIHRVNMMNKFKNVLPPWNCSSLFIVSLSLTLTSYQGRIYVIALGGISGKGVRGLNFQGHEWKSTFQRIFLNLGGGDISPKSAPVRASEAWVVKVLNAFSPYPRSHNIFWVSKFVPVHVLRYVIYTSIVIGTHLL